MQRLFFLSHLFLPKCEHVLCYTASEAKLWFLLIPCVISRHDSPSPGRLSYLPLGEPWIEPIPLKKGTERGREREENRHPCRNTRVGGCVAVDMLRFRLESCLKAASWRADKDGVFLFLVSSFPPCLPLSSFHCKNWMFAHVDKAGLGRKISGRKRCEETGNSKNPDALCLLALNWERKKPRVPGWGAVVGGHGGSPAPLALSGPGRRTESRRGPATGQLYEGTRPPSRLPEHRPPLLGIRWNIWM